MRSALTSYSPSTATVKAKDTMRGPYPGNPTYTKFVQTKVLGEAACWALCLQWIATMNLSQAASSLFLDALRGNERFRQGVRDDQAKLIAAAGQDRDPFTKSFEQGNRLPGLRKDGSTTIKRFDPNRAGGDASFYTSLSEALAARPRGRGDYFVICGLTFQALGGLGHAIAGRVDGPQFTYFDPNGGVLVFPFAQDFRRWFDGSFVLATENHYDKIAIAEFDYYLGR